MEASGSSDTVFTSQEPLPYNRWLYVKAMSNTESFGILVLGLDGEFVTSNFYQPGDLENYFTLHGRLFDPGYDLVIGSDFRGLIKGLIYYPDSPAGHSQLPALIPRNFDYRSVVRNDVLVFFSFTKQFLAPSQSKFLGMSAGS